MFNQIGLVLVFQSKPCKQMYLQNKSQVTSICNYYLLSYCYDFNWCLPRCQLVFTARTINKASNHSTLVKPRNIRLMLFSSLYTCIHAQTIVYRPGYFTVHPPPGSKWTKIS